MYTGIRNDECIICEESLLKGSDLYHILIDDVLCFKCRQKLKGKIKFTKFLDYPLISFYDYNPEVSRLLIRYKDLLDKPLAPIFLEEWVWVINLIFKKYKIVLIPSSKTLKEYRGFNHLKNMLEKCHLEHLDLLEKDDSVQRFEKNRLDLNFKFKEVPEKLGKVIIFDDVITSGASMEAAIKLLAPITKKIILISIIRNIK